MGNRSDDAIRKVTTELSNEILREQLRPRTDFVFRPVPHAHLVDGDQPVWRVHFDLTYDSQVRIGLDVNGEATLGRAHEADDFVDLSEFADAEQFGVSRRHAMLRPTNAKLYIVDLDSTNGTWLNNHSIGVNTPHSLSNGDLLRVGRLEFMVRILKQPGHSASAPHQTADLGEALPSIARAIHSQLQVSQVLEQAMEMAARFAPADEITVWLVDEPTGELFLEAGLGANEMRIQRLPVADTLAGKVIKTGKPMRANRQQDEGQIKLKTGYMVEAIIYVPLSLGGVPFGVMSAAHRERGKMFTSHDEKVLAAIADMTAVAVHNARLSQATERALTRHAKVVTALSYALSYDFKNLVKSTVGYSGMLENDASLNGDTINIATHIGEAGNRMALLIDRLSEVAKLCENPAMHSAPCDLAEVVGAAVDDLQFVAAAKGSFLEFQLIGEPCVIVGDDTHLYRTVRNLVDNAIKFSPRGAQIIVSLVFGHSDIIIRVRDTGPGIPEDDLPYLFDKYYRSGDGQSGLGLGLEVVCATVEAHRGSIIARNAEDGGAEFIITLPGTLRVG